MVPLPLHAERIGAEDIGGGQALHAIVANGLGLGHLAVEALVGRAVVADDRPVVDPLHGLQVGHAAKCTQVFLHDGPPLALSILNEGTLVNGVWHVVIGFLHHHLLLVGAEDVLRAEDGLSAGPAAVGGIDVIVVAYLVEVAALQSVTVGDDSLVALEVEVLVKLADGYVANAAGHVDLAVVEEHARVVVATRQLLHLPLALWIGGRQQPALQVPAVDGQLLVNQDVELAVVVLHGAGPHARTVGIGRAVQVVGHLVGKLLQRVCAVLPVHHVLRLQDGGAGEVVHRRRHHIIGIAHANDIRVGEVGPHDGILIRATHIADRHAGKVGLRIVHVVVVGIPAHAGFAASLLQSAEGRHHLIVVYQLVDVDEAAGA